MEKQIEQIQKQIDKIMDNELVHLKTDIAGVREEVGIIRTNVEWLMKIWWIVAASSVGGLITGILSFILKR